MLASDTSVIQAPSDRDWPHRAETARILGVHVTKVPDAVMKYRIDHQIMFGQRRYYRPDVERAAQAIAEMRGKRAAA